MRIVTTCWCTVCLPGRRGVPWARDSGSLSGQGIPAPDQASLTYPDYCRWLRDSIKLVVLSAQPVEGGGISYKTEVEEGITFSNLPLTSQSPPVRWKTKTTPDDKRINISFLSEVH
ncbi:hypothetical protein PRIC1_012459 [Phytophthora ramorum]